MLLSAFALQLHLLLPLQTLRDASLAQRLLLAALVGLDVEGALQGGVASHARHHVLPKLLLEVEESQGSELDGGLDTEVIGKVARNALQLLDSICDSC